MSDFFIEECKRDNAYNKPVDKVAQEAWDCTE